ncbi:MAG: FRG domain-containing protein [Candidatus Omnitrophota bacterium]
MTKYKDIFEVVKYFRDTAPTPPPFLKGKPNDYYWVDARDSLPEGLEWVNCGRDFSPGQLMPSIFSGGLYRGQTEIYSPCRPRIYRGFPLVQRPRELSVKYRTRFLASQIKTTWFVSLLREHPALRYARKLKIQINPNAIAQHYGISTDYLDLTQSIDVAAFFACCEQKDQIWEPKSEGQGVIYRLNSFVSLERRRSIAELVGLVTFPRPGEQKAWVVPVRMGFDFANAPQVETFIFNHTFEGSRHYLNMFNLGKSLFLEDPTAELAKSVINSSEIPENFVTDVLLRFGCLPEKLKKTFKVFAKRLKYHCKLEVKKKVPICFTKEHIRKIKLYLYRYKNDFMGIVHPVRTSNPQYLTNNRL